MVTDRAGLSGAEPAETGGSLDALRRLRAYREALQRQFPALTPAVLEAEAISETDALALGYFLEAVPGEVVVLAVGDFLGIAAVHLAGLPNVARVVVRELGPPPDVPVADPEPAGPGPVPRELSGLDATKQALELAPAERARIELGGELLQSLQRSPVTLTARPTVLGVLERRRSREAVRTALEALFATDPEAVAIVDDCRHRWGPFVQAGVASLLERAPGRHRFRLFCDLTPALAGCDLGCVYAASSDASIEPLLARFAEAFSGRFDVLALLAREEALVGAMGRRAEELAEARRQTEEARRQLGMVLASRTWRLMTPARAAARAARRVFQRATGGGPA